MIRKQSAEEQIATMQRLINFGVNEDSSTSSKPIVEYKKKAANGKTYGIVRESTKFYIMEAPEKDTEVLAEDFNYIGGFNNRKENEYSSYAKAANALDLKIMSINETVEKQKRVVVETPRVKADWEDSITESMRQEIDRFKSITANVATILKEDKGVGSIPSEHTLPEAPATHPSEADVLAPYEHSGVHDGTKDFKEEEHNHETAGKPFDQDGKIDNNKMQSDKKPVVKATDTYSEKAKYVPENSVADQNPSGGKVVRVNENNGHKIRLKLTEEQVLAWNDNKNYMDTSNDTSIGSSEPYVNELGEESNQTEAPTEPIHEEAPVVHNTDNQNVPTPGTSTVGDGQPYSNKVNEEIEDAEDDGVPFPEVEDEDGAYKQFEKDFDEWENSQDDDTIEIELDGNDDVDDSAAYNNDNLKGLEGWERTWNVFDDDDYPVEDVLESRKRRSSRLSEEKLDVFGKHPAYRKKPMTTPPNKEVAINGAREWDDESAQGEEPFGKQIGDGSPYEEIVSAVTESLLSAIYGKKKV